MVVGVADASHRWQYPRLSGSVAELKPGVLQPPDYEISPKLFRECRLPTAPNPPPRVEYEQELSEYERSLGLGKYWDRNGYRLMSECLQEETGVGELRRLLSEWGVKWAEKPFAGFRR